MLEVKGLEVVYGNIKALRGVSFKVEEGDIVTLVGANGAGKSTVLKAISGLVPVKSGSIRFRNENLLAYPAERIVELGIAHVPEGRIIFGNLTVMENLELGAYCRRDKEGIKRDLERVFRIFPRLAERRRQLGGTLSGGEQQMLAVGRGLMARAKLMLLDEPSMGLSPLLVREIFEVIREINKEGTTILLIEQNAHMAFKIARYAYVLETGQVVFEGEVTKLERNEELRKAYLGA